MAGRASARALTAAKDFLKDQNRRLEIEVEKRTRDIHETGLTLAERYGFSIYDAMIAAAAIHAGCDTLWSEDMQHGMAIDEGLRIVNPFRVAG